MQLASIPCFEIVAAFVLPDILCSYILGFAVSLQFSKRPAHYTVLALQRHRCAHYLSPFALHPSIYSKLISARHRSCLNSSLSGRLNISQPLRIVSALLVSTVLGVVLVIFRSLFFDFYSCKQEKVEFVTKEQLVGLLLTHGFVRKHIDDEETASVDLDVEHSSGLATRRKKAGKVAWEPESKRTTTYDDGSNIELNEITKDV